MACRPIWVGWLALSFGVLWVNGVTADAPAGGPQQLAVSLVPFEELPENERAAIRLVVDQPTLYAHGPSEVFAGRPEVYHWLLHHPDRAAAAWTRLGAKCMPIEGRGSGTFGWCDGHGSDLSWQMVYHGPQLCIWYAQGKFRPAPFLPLVPVRAVVLLRFLEAPTSGRRAVLHHQADIFVQADSKAVTLAAKLMGDSAPRLAEHCLAQMELFFSGLAWYVERYPQRAAPLGLPVVFHLTN